jgi:exodeoxyribonuclease VII large subunit
MDEFSDSPLGRALSQSPGQAGEPPGSNLPEQTVSELANSLKKTIEDAYGFVRVRGELGRVVVAKSGHVYFDIKDANATLNSVMWKGQAGKLPFKPEEGLEVVAEGRLSTYPGRSNYQLIAERMRPAGAGALMALLEERRKKFLAEGLFDKSRKRPLPYLPRVIGVVTSPTGAVIRDILHRLDDRFPSHVVVWPVRVQGETSAAEVAAAIAGFNALPPDGPIARPDLLIVARGGGSIEDLWGFNEEVVVRAVVASAIPVISAVGHETDTTLIDYAADMRAPTPSAAAEAAVPVRAELIAYVDDHGLRLRQAARRVTANYRDRLRAAGAGLPRPLDLIAVAGQRLDHAASNLLAALRHMSQMKAIQLAKIRLSHAALAAGVNRARLRFDPRAQRLEPAMRQVLERRQQRLDGLGKLLLTLGYKSVLARGFAIVKDHEGELVRSGEFLRAGDALRIQFADGEVPAIVGPDGVVPPPKPRRPRSPASEDEQPDLF